MKPVVYTQYFTMNRDLTLIVYATDERVFCHGMVPNSGRHVTQWSDLPEALCYEWLPDGFLDRRRMSLDEALRWLVEGA